ncbi:hypothetical protein Glove_301g25 [Diversispora epigaea]|uniref:TLDc domain-containing protein n=1 Tax=Diversispora epigaea TaxID=1348612 RepID=A0A397I1W5_9GLOM|nr:hypothetical protein Glove_301g25 [Diversispora epigaea]
MYTSYPLFHLSSIEVVDKIKPYKKIIDKLWEDINQHLLIPDRPVKSTILPPRSVLNMPTAYTLINIPYKFELILRGTQDGFAPQTFWNICHGQVGTVVLLKVKGTDEIIGGYNPLAWDNSNNGRKQKIVLFSH